MVSDNGEKEIQPESGPRNAKMMIGIDWENDTIIFQEKAKGGIQLVNPMTFNVPVDTIIQLADSIREHKFELLRRLRAEAKEISGRLNKQVIDDLRNGIIKS